MFNFKSRDMNSAKISKVGSLYCFTNNFLFLVNRNMRENSKYYRKESVFKY